MRRLVAVWECRFKISEGRFLEGCLRGSADSYESARCNALDLLQEDQWQITLVHRT